MTPITMQSLRLEPKELTKNLTDILGARMVAFLGGAKSTRSVRGWIRGEYPPSQLDHLHLAKQLVDVILTRDEPDVVRAWFAGVNHLLDDQSPAVLLASHGDQSDTKRALIQAARAFIAG
jgi:hypothetical protein